MTLEELKTKVEEDLFIDESNAAEKSLKLSSIYSKYLAIYIQALKILKKISTDKDKLYGDLYHHFKFNNVDKNGTTINNNNNFPFQLDSAKEIETYAKSDDSYYKKCLEFQNAEIIVDYLEKTLKNITNTGYSIKTFVELKKLSMGLN